METNDMIAPLVGGGLVGLAAGGLWLTHGRIAGVSGLCASLLDPGDDARSVKAAFLAGLVLTGALLAWTTPALFHNPTTLPGFAVLVAGVLVGYGARLGNGCTSGHGICGLGRLSLRSVVACTAFTVVGVASQLLVGVLTGGVR